MAAPHLFVCTNGRSSGKPACGPRGGDALVAAVQRELLVRGATEVLVTPCGCLGPCFDGPNAVVYPEAAWYAGLEAGDAAALADRLVGLADGPAGASDGLGGARLAAKRTERPGLAAPDDAG